MSLIDSHTHLDSFARSGELPAVLQRARDAGLEAMIAIGTAPDDWPLYREIAGENPGFVHYAVGLHPCSVEADWAGAVAQIEAFWESGTDARREKQLGPELEAGSPVAAVYDRRPSVENSRRGSADSTGSRQAIPPDQTGGHGPPLQNPGWAQRDTMGAACLGSADRGRDARATRPVALGETGLDRFHLPKDPAGADAVFGWQRAAFAAQLEIAKRLGCPLVVHSRGAFRECVEQIDASGCDWTKVVFHCFTEGAAEMAELVRRGGYGSFTGVLTYKNADAVRAAAKAQGLARLMLETDAPYLTPMPHRGKPNEPAFVRHTAEFAAALFGVDYDELAATTTANVRRFYGL